MLFRSLHIPDVVTEKVLLDNIAKHGFRGGEMGQCLKFCVPKNIRQFDPAYSRTPMRKYGVTRDDSLESRATVDRLLSSMQARGADHVIVSSADELRKSNVNLQAILPGATSAITLAVTVPQIDDNALLLSGARDHINFLCYDLTRALEELGHRSVMTIKRGNFIPEDPFDANPTDAILTSIGTFNGQTVMANTVVTRKVLAPQQRGADPVRTSFDHGNASANLTSHIGSLARSLGADLVGMAPASRFDEMAPQLRPLFEVKTLTAIDKSERFNPWNPKIENQQRTVKTPADWLPGAKNVIVLGLRYHKEVLRWATKPPAEAVGPYAFQTYVSNWVAAMLGYRIIKELEKFGYTGALTMDLMNTASTAASPRGPQHDLFANRFAGLAAGLGYLTVSGHLATPEFGLRQRIVAIVTNAPLDASPLFAGAAGAACDNCDEPCISSCPSAAITSSRATVTCEGHDWSFNQLDPARCDWVKRYALMGDGGYKFLGSTVDIAPPDVITPDALADALRQLDPIKKYRPIVAEPCVLNCPLATQD